MDVKSSKYLQVSPFSSPHNVGGVTKGNPIVDSSSLDPLSKLNLMETSDFVKSFPMGRSKKDSNKSNLVEAPPTPGRPVFSFSSVGNNVTRNKFVPSKWNDAEKWLNSDHNQTRHHHLEGFASSADFVSKNIKSTSSNSSNGIGIKQQERHHQEKVVLEKSAEELSIIRNHHHHHNAATPFSASDVAKDKFTNEIEPNSLKFECWEPLSESFLFRETSMVDAAGTGVRDIGTEMTPLGSSTTSRCPTPFKSMSPPRHNTPTNTSGPLVAMDSRSSFDIGGLQECHLLKLNLETPFDSVISNWSSREEEEEDVSKSLRHFEMSNECRTSISETRASVWEEEEKTKCCLRYQREEAKIQAWVDLQKAKAEAQSRKLEVKIQKMRSKFEEKQMRKMAIVHRKAEELRAAAKLEHIQKGTQKPNKLKVIDQHQHQHQNMHHFSGHCVCGCFPCNSLHP